MNIKLNLDPFSEYRHVFFNIQPTGSDKMEYVHNFLNPNNFNL